MKGVAIIMGGGIAGMCCAQVVSKYFDKVIILEANRFCSDAATNPQAHHLHVLMQRGREILERIFPGIDRILADRGCPEIDWAQDTLWISRHGAFPRYKSGIRTRSASRRLLEQTIQKIILKNSNIKIMDQYSIKEILTKENLIYGIANQYGEKVYGNFFINALGRKNIFLNKETLQISPLKVYYTSCLIRDFICIDNYKQIYIQMCASDKPLGAVVNPIEDGAHQLTLLTKDSAPFSNQEDILRAISRISHCHFRKSLENAKIISSVKKFCHSRGFRTKDNACYSNMLTVSDARCVFNPLYGQGMTLAAIEAEIIDKYFSRNRPIQQYIIARADKLPWLIAAAEDCVLIGKNNHRIDLSKRILNFFFDLGVRLAVKYRLVHRLLLQTLHMIPFNFKNCIPNIG